MLFTPCRCKIWSTPARLHRNDRQDGVATVKFPTGICYATSLMNDATSPSHPGALWLRTQTSKVQPRAGFIPAASTGTAGQDGPLDTATMLLPPSGLTVNTAGDAGRSDGSVLTLPDRGYREPVTVRHTSSARSLINPSPFASTPHTPLHPTDLTSARQSQVTEHYQPATVVFSGGTAFNSVAGALRSLTTKVAHVLPVSDDGGSTAEIVRVVGGPAVGDIRSRCLRLADDHDEEAKAVKRLLAHRLSSSSSREAKLEWYSIVEGQHELWAGVSEPYKHTIRAFLLHFHGQIMGHSSELFNFRNGSVGNFFFAGARLFFRSLEAAIFLFARVARMPEGSLVLPAICTEERIVLGAELEDGTVIKGQNDISHPPGEGDSSHVVDKSAGAQPQLVSPIRRVFYLSKEGCAREHEVFPQANPRVLAEVDRADAIIFGIGSLYTSICPTLCLDGVGEHIASRDVPKILMLNGSHDRETSSYGTHDGPMTAADMVQAIADALNRRRNRRGQPLRNPASKYVTALLVPHNGAVAVDATVLHFLGISQVLEVASSRDDEGRVLFDPAALVAAVAEVIGSYQPQSQLQSQPLQVLGPVE